MSAGITPKPPRPLPDDLPDDLSGAQAQLPHKMKAGDDLDATIKGWRTARR